MHRFPANLPQEKPQISTESVWDFFSHVAYYNQQLSWANFIQKDDCLKDLKVPPPQLTPVSSSSVDFSSRVGSRPVMSSPVQEWVVVQC